MSDLIVQGNNYVSNSISVSRNVDEQIGVISGNNNYTVLANLISDNITYIDSFIEHASRFIGDYAVLHTLDKQYFDSKNSWIQNAFKRNIYINPVEEQKNSMERQMKYYLFSLGSEVLLKCGTRFVANKLNEIDIFNFYYNLYSLLDFYANYDSDKLNGLTNIELKKIRSAFELTPNQKKKIERKTIENRSKSIENLNIGFLSDLSTDAKVSVSYLIYTIAATKYIDDQAINDSLIYFYNVLGFSSAASKGIIQMNRESYNNILDNQHKMNQIARGIINHIGRVMIDIPSVNVDSIMQRGKDMAKYDPFYQRRKNVETIASKGVKAGGKIGFNLICSKYPGLAMLASSEAFSQLNLNNPQMLEIGSKLLNDWFKDSKTEDQILAKSKDIKKEAIDLN